MTNLPNSVEYKQQIAASFDKMADYDNDYTYHRAKRLVELAQLETGQTVLDVATGTGIAAMAAAHLVGPEGKVVGVDIAPSMLERARQKIAAAGLHNIELIEKDVDYIDFANESFDIILCSSSIMWLSNIPAAFSNWHRWLTKNGVVAFSCYAETSFMISVVVNFFAKHGISLPNCNEPLGTVEKCHQLLGDAGFSNIAIETEQLGSYLSISKAKNYWTPHKAWMTPGGNPLLQLSQEQLAKLKVAYDAEIESLATAEGVWEDIKIFYVISRS